MTIGSILGAIVIGLIIGALGRLIVPGKQNIPIWMTIAIGVVAALIGTFIVGALQDTRGFDWVEIVVQVALAAVGVYAVSAMRSRRSLTR